MKKENLWKKIFKVAAVAVLSFGISSYSLPISLYAQEVVNISVLQTVNELDSNSLWKWQVESDKNSELPKTLFGSLSDIYEGEPQDISHKFLYDYPEIFGLGKSSNDYAVKEIIERKYATYIVYTQTYENIPVENSYLLISVTRNGKISLAKSKIFHQIDISTNPQISEEMAYNIALEDIRKGSFIEEPGNIELIILPHKDKFILAWNVQFRTDRFGEKIEYVISSKGGIINKKRTRINQFDHKTKEDNPLLKEKEIIKALNSLGNIHLKNEALFLLGKICACEKYNSKDFVTHSIITSDLNISGEENLLYILDILLKNNLLDKKLYYKFKHDIYKKKDKVDEKPEYNPITPMCVNKNNPPSPVVARFSLTQSDNLTITQMQVQDFQNTLTLLMQMQVQDIQNTLTLLYQSFASSNTTASMQRWDILKIQQAVSLNSNIALEIAKKIAKTSKKISDKWDQYIQS